MNEADVGGMSQQAETAVVQNEDVGQETLKKEVTLVES